MTFQVFLTHFSHEMDISDPPSFCFMDVHPSILKPTFHGIICYLHRIVHILQRHLFLKKTGKGFLKKQTKGFSSAGLNVDC